MAPQLQEMLPARVHVPLMQDAKVSHVVDPVLDVQG
jgi:hypothetical protein